MILIALWIATLIFAWWKVPDALPHATGLARAAVLCQALVLPAQIYVFLNGLGLNGDGVPSTLVALMILAFVGFVAGIAGIIAAQVVNKRRQSAVTTRR